MRDQCPSSEPNLYCAPTRCAGATDLKGGHKSKLPKSEKPCLSFSPKTASSIAVQLLKPRPKVPRRRQLDGTWRSIACHIGQSEVIDGAMQPLRELHAAARHAHETKAWSSLITSLLFYQQFDKYIRKPICYDSCAGCRRIKIVFWHL